MRKQAFWLIFVLAVMMSAAMFTVAQASCPSVTTAEVNGRCGFGLRVTADGTYTRINAKKPTFN